MDIIVDMFDSAEPTCCVSKQPSLTTTIGDQSGDAEFECDVEQDLPFTQQPPAKRTTITFDTLKKEAVAMELCAVAKLNQRAAEYVLKIIHARTWAKLLANPNHCAICSALAQFCHD